MKRSAKIVMCSLGSIIIIGAGFLFVRIMESGSSNTVLKNGNANPAPIELPKTVYDGIVGIPLTKISVAYPTKGFYDLGIKFIPYNMWNNLYGVTGGIGTTVPVPVDPTRVSEAIALTLDVRPAKKGSDLKALIKELNDNGPEYRPNGVIKTINGDIFYIAKSGDSDIDVYDAYTQIQDLYIHVGFQYPRGGGRTNEIVAGNNEKVFYDYLTNLNIEEGKDINPPRFSPVNI